jgi:hypothetical protein
MITVCGKTEDGKSVVYGIYRFFETEGVPLDVIFEILKLKNAIPDWMAFVKEATAAGMKPSRIISMLDTAISDSYGLEMRNAVIPKLHEIYFSETKH